MSQFLPSLQIYEFDCRFHAIPREQNPAYGYVECVMIVQSDKYDTSKFLVLHIEPDPINSVKPIGAFWSADDARLFALAFRISRSSVCEMEPIGLN